MTGSRVLTRAERQAVADAVIQEVGTLLEFWSEKTEGTPAEGLDVGDVREAVSGWMRRLPGTSWHFMLNQ